MEGIYIPIVMFITLGTVVIFIRKYMNDERMAMIEKGMNVGEFKGKDTNPTFYTLRLGLLLIGLGLGIICGGILAPMFPQEEVAYFSSIFIFGGIGLIVAYVLENKKRETLN